MRHLILALFLILVTRSIGSAEPKSGFDPCLETTQENRTKCEETCSDDRSLREKSPADNRVMFSGIQSSNTVIKKPST